jgi:AcrR family transcriptional regulator
MTEFSGRTDPDRILPLLWRHRAPSAGRPTGRPPKLTVDAVVAAAVALADADGLEATSMAKVAARLGVGTMTLYTYVPSRAELVDVMVDDVLASRALPGPGEPRPDDWRGQVGLYADRTREMYRAHPWLSQVTLVRPPIGPGMLAEREYVLSTVSGLGLPVHRVNPAALAITAFVTAGARQEADSAQARRVTGESDDEWWLRRMRLWEDWFDVERHPAMNDLWNAGGFAESEDTFAYGLRVLLDGIAADAAGISPA